MMKATVTGVLLLGIGSLFQACNTSNNMEKGTMVSLEEYRKLKEEKDNNGKRFAIVGYPYICGDVERGVKKKASLLVYTEPNGRGEMMVWLPLPFGTGRNQFFVPDNSSKANIQLFDNNGNQIHCNEKTVFSFTIDLDTEKGKRENFYFRKKADGSSLEKIKSIGYFYTLRDVRIDKG